jgi:DNA mismatch endonuclease (patch repair protein)
VADKFSSKKRSEIMSRISGHDTQPEKSVRSLLHNMGYRFRLHRSNLPGKPDIVLPRHKKIIFVHGCFWHGHKGCNRSQRPTSNVEFWNRKLTGNIERDKRILSELKRSSWKTLIVWGCQTRTADKLRAKLLKFLSEPN